MKKIILFVGSLLLVFNAYAHSGRTDSKGCHTDHKTGTRHCH